MAAICVLLLHTRAVYGGKFVFGRGYLGVDFFLMLSGYLMARAQEPRLAAGLSARRFLAQRYRRLWPMMAAGGLIGVPMQFLRSAGLVRFAVSTGANLLIVPVFFGPFVFPLNIPAWTIFYELVANALHVTLLWRLRGKAFVAVLLLLAGATVWVGLHYGSLNVGAKPETFLAGLPRIAFAYMIGMGLSRWWRDTPPLPVPPLLALVVMPAAIAGSWALGLQSAWFDIGFVGMVCPLMIAGALRLRRFGRAAGVLGQLSFPLFALQMPVLEGLRALRFGYWSGCGAALAAGVVGAVVANRLSARRGVRVNMM